MWVAEEGGGGTQPSVSVSALTKLGTARCLADQYTSVQHGNVLHGLKAGSIQAMPVYCRCSCSCAHRSELTNAGRCIASPSMQACRKGTGTVLQALKFDFGQRMEVTKMWEREFDQLLDWFLVKVGSSPASRRGELRECASNPPDVHSSAAGQAAACLAAVAMDACTAPRVYEQDGRTSFPQLLHMHAHEPAAPRLASLQHPSRRWRCKIHAGEPSSSLSGRVRR